MAVVSGPVEFMMGAPENESSREPDEVLHVERIEHSFAIATKEITQRQLLDYQREVLSDGEREVQGDLEVAAAYVYWNQAAKFCNWLSKEEGIPEDQWCYLPNSEGKYAKDVKLAPNSLRRTGYRLPTNPEWEYACRAGTVTSRHSGRSEEILREYAWWMKNSGGRIHPVGSRKPNDLGLFNMHGNVGEWCHEAIRKEEYLRYFRGQLQPAPLDVDHPINVDTSRYVSAHMRHSRGQTSGVRSANRYQSHADLVSANRGFRVARTMPGQ